MENKINKLKVIQNTALRIATGALKSTPILSLRCKTIMFPLITTTEENFLNYNKIHYFPNNNPVKPEVLADMERCEGLNWNHNKSY